MEFKVIKEVGRGAFAVCKLVQHTVDGQYYAVKELERTGDITSNETEILSALKEADILIQLEHPHVIRQYGHYIDPKSASMNIIMEYAEHGSLRAQLSALKAAGKQLTAEKVWDWLIQLLLALDFVHSKKVLHRDIKPENILLTGPDAAVLKLGDFGISRVLSGVDELANTRIGTPYYLAPEVYNGKEYGMAADMWSLGVVLYELLTLERPFTGKNAFMLGLAILEGERAPFRGGEPVELVQLVEELLVVDPTQRPSAKNLLARPNVRARVDEWEAKRRELPLPHHIPGLVTVSPKEVLEQWRAAVAYAGSSAPERAVAPATAPSPRTPAAAMASMEGDLLLRADSGTLEDLSPPRPDTVERGSSMPGASRSYGGASTSNSGLMYEVAVESDAVGRGVGPHAAGGGGGGGEGGGSHAAYAYASDTQDLGGSITWDDADFPEYESITNELSGLIDAMGMGTEGLRHTAEAYDETVAEVAHHGTPEPQHQGLQTRRGLASVPELALSTSGDMSASGPLSARSTGTSLVSPLAVSSVALEASSQQARQEWKHMKENHRLFVWGGGKIRPRLQEKLLPHDVKDISAGAQHFVCLTQDGGVLVWGSDCHSGQLGCGEGVQSRKHPGPMKDLSPEGRLSATAIAAGRDFTVVCCAGKVVVWGRVPGLQATGSDDETLQLLPIASFLSPTSASDTPTAANEDEKEEETTLDDGVLWKPAVLAQLPAVIYQVACGEDFVLALAGNGELWSWGENDMGVLGVGDTKYRVNPVRVTTMLQAKREKSGSGSKKHDKSGKSQRKVETFSMPAIYHIAAGTSHCLALIEGPEDSRVVLSWGHGSRGQLGIKERLLDRYTAAITGDGATACPPDTLQKPCAIPQLSKLQVITVAAGNDHSGAVTSMGRLYMWGSNEFGQCGGKPKTSKKRQEAFLEEPQRVSDLEHQKINAVACGEDYTLASTSDGRVFAWGRADGGRLGNGSGAKALGIFTPPSTTVDSDSDTDSEDASTEEESSSSSSSEEEEFGGGDEFDEFEMPVEWEWKPSMVDGLPKCIGISASMFGDYSFGVVQSGMKSAV